MFNLEPADLRVGDIYRCGKDPFGLSRAISEISRSGDYMAWESSDGRHYGTLHVRQFCNFASGPHGGQVETAQ